MENGELASVLSSIKDQIRNFDAKAQIAIGIDGLIAGLLAAEIIKAAEYEASGMHLRFAGLIVIASLSIVCCGVSFAFAFLTVWPRLRFGQPRSHYYFRDLAQQYGADFERAAQSLRALSQPEAAMELGTQIQANALICTRKAAHCNRTLAACATGLIGYLLSLSLFGSMAYSDAAAKRLQPVKPLCCCSDALERKPALTK
ncbi:MAG: Pycsar system effector family protein [Terracidiphilus sp.]|jgi:hypothetical protein